MGEGYDIVMNIRQGSRLGHLFMRSSIYGKGHVLFYALAEQHIILRYISRTAAHGSNRHVIHIRIIQKYGSIGYVIGAQQQIHQGGLACTGAADESYLLSGLDSKRDILQHIPISAGVAESQMLQLDLSGE